MSNIRNLTDEHPDSKIHGANMGSIWGRQDPGGPHVGPMNFDIWANSLEIASFSSCNVISYCALISLNEKMRMQLFFSFPFIILDSDKDNGIFYWTWDPSDLEW